jgi:hypothetical protein
MTVTFMSVVFNTLCRSQHAGACSHSWKPSHRNELSQLSTVAPKQGGGNATLWYWNHTSIHVESANLVPTG